MREKNSNLKEKQLRTRCKKEMKLKKKFVWSLLLDIPQLKTSKLLLFTIQNFF